MIPQLADRITKSGVSPDNARRMILTADPLDLVLHMEQVWSAFDPAAINPARARQILAGMGEFNQFRPAPTVPGESLQRWDHLAYSYVLENTRAVQIMKRVVRAFRSGEAIGIPSRETLRWLDTSEALLFGAGNPFAGWLSTSPFTADGETERRIAYWRLLGLDLAFGTEENRPPVFDKATAANANFVTLFEELLFEVWQAITNVRNLVGVNNADDDRIFRLAEALTYILRARRQGDLHGSVLAREELAAATVLGWIDLTLSADTPVVVDAGAQATNSANRLANLGAKVGLPAHSKSSSLFSMAAEISAILRVIESGVIINPTFAWVLYRETSISPGVQAFGAEARRVITEWAAATGKDLKTRAKPVETSGKRLVAVK